MNNYLKIGSIFLLLISSAFQVVESDKATKKAKYLSEKPNKNKKMTEHNRKIMEDFADIFYRQKDVEKAFKEYVAENYIQHNPNILDGREAAISALKPKFSSPDAIFDIKRIIVDGDMAVIHLHGRMNKNQLGGAVADIYRLSDGKIVEHWDVLQPIPEKAVNPHPMF
ncbi:putative SnoaL-like aldol condensation-catalyzing enzyme [Arcicella aurantiaca]|uniref:Putative SnoaL-like aldol condensation-catalyzing enzyme n=1 Tax=Arcicella aurantiaca TaxID=591202 RepID=A0A316DYM4_9BACT|nr:nuclear transport factor 2 family protein [Arcicella aurantiaca]PWK21623.1 putative SnoaL-like aldol condensation-catalyzing enzyme [Arcicella aurantiaca]